MMLVIAKAPMVPTQMNLFDAMVVMLVGNGMTTFLDQRASTWTYMYMLYLCDHTVTNWYVVPYVLRGT